MKYSFRRIVKTNLKGLDEQPEFNEKGDHK